MKLHVDDIVETLQWIPASPCSHLLLNNEEPTDGELLQIRAAQKLAEDEMVRLRVESQTVMDLSPPPVVCKQLLLKERLQDFIDCHRGAASAVRRIPNDVLLEIFHYLKPPLLESCSPRNNLFDILFVCRRWYSCALSAGLLWSELYVFPWGKLEDLIWRVSIHLRGSQQLPLKLVLALDSDSGKRNLEFQLLDLLRAHASRWRDVRLDVDMIHYAHIARSTAVFSSLERLEACLTATGIRRSREQAQLFLNRFSGLAQLSLALKMDERPFPDLCRFLTPILPCIHEFRLEGYFGADLIWFTLLHLSQGAKASFVISVRWPGWSSEVLCTSVHELEIVSQCERR
ncbi:hypothetical protein C8F01DRAFT_339876 [Mycena amicta]|nr:hypothetical protein C8F01DRAFT_339876 [Mycena amicta]